MIVNIDKPLARVALRTRPIRYAFVGSRSICCRQPRRVGGQVASSWDCGPRGPVGARVDLRGGQSLVRWKRRTRCASTVRCVAVRVDQPVDAVFRLHGRPMTVRIEDHPCSAARFDSFIGAEFGQIIILTRTEYIGPKCDNNNRFVDSSFVIQDLAIHFPMRSLRASPCVVYREWRETESRLSAI